MHGDLGTRLREISKTKVLIMIVHCEETCAKAKFGRRLDNTMEMVLEKVLVEKCKIHTQHTTITAAITYNNHACTTKGGVKAELS